MALLIERGADEGTWFTWGRDPETDLPVRFLIRSIPAAVSRPVLRQHGLNKVIGGTRGVEIDIERREKANRDLAAYALLNTEGFAVRAEHAAAAEQFAALVGGPVEVGKDLVLDGRWNDRLKGHVFTEHPRIASWIVAKATSLEAQAAEEEEGKE